MIEQLIYASILGLCLGLERALKQKPASFSTFSLVSATSCLFTILSSQTIFSDNVDETRIAAQIVSGMGFVGAGVIFKNSDKIEGITTAVMLWFAAAIGMSCGFNQILLAFSAVLVYYISIVLSILLHKTVDFVYEKINNSNH